MSLLITLTASIFILFLIASSKLITVKNGFNKCVNTSDIVNISVIISVRNEENEIKKLVDRLNNLIYPKNNFEIIIIDDNSTDSTLDELLKNINGISEFYC